MSPITDPLRRCDGVRRREALRVGALTALGLTVGALPRLRASDATATAMAKAEAKSCILIWLDGGPSHLETFDPKPDASAETRGPFDSIATATPGVRIAEVLPETAKRLNKIAIIRSMTSPLGEHNLGSYYLLSGYMPTPALRYPSLGSVASRIRGEDRASRDRAAGLPLYIGVPSVSPAAGEGYLPVSCRPFEVGGDPSSPNFRVRDLDPYPGLDAKRLARRREFLDSFDRAVQSSANANADEGESDPEFEQAHRLIMSPQAKKAFELSEESDRTRDRYGRRTIGQSCLLARRLIERGVPFVTVTDRGWDTHDSLVLRLKEGYAGAKVGVGLGPTFDQAYSALLDDLADRRLLDETLVLVMGEFGRTPKLNTRGGRDHWPRVFSVALAGGGTRGGQVIGASDAMGESPADRPVTPSDLARTVYQLLGIDPSRSLTTPEGRPVAINQGGRLIAEVIG